MGLYAVAANVVDGHGRHKLLVGSLESPGPREAQEAADAFAYRHFPRKKGWHSHNAVADPIRPARSLTHWEAL